MKQKYLAMVITLALVMPAAGFLRPLIALAQDVPEGVPNGAVAATVTGYIDGDKFKVELNGKEETVLLISADAPEMGKDGDPGQCFAQESTDRLKELLPSGTKVYLEKDSTDRDGKDRLLRYVWLPREGKKAQFIDERMVADGYSTFKARDENGSRDARMQKAENIAKEKQRGLWKACGGGHVEITPVPKLGSGDNPAPIGTALEADGRRITITNAYFTDSYSFLAPQQNFIFLVVDVTMENMSESGKTHDYNELCFAAKDVERNADFDDSLLNPSDRPLGSGDMLPGDVVSGEVVIEVHQDSTQIRVKYSTGPGCIGGKSLYWLVVR